MRLSSEEGGATPSLVMTNACHACDENAFAGGAVNVDVAAVPPMTDALQHEVPGVDGPGKVAKACPDELIWMDDAHSPEDEQFMRMAIDQARLAASLGEVPIGAVVVCDGEVISRAFNRRELDHDPSGHAEFAAMVAAARRLDRWRLSGCTVYVTLEPCLMCAGLMVNARVDRCVYGAPDPKGGALGTLYDVSHDPRLNHEFDVCRGVLREECAEVLRTFFADLRRLRKAARATPESPLSQAERKQ